MYLVSEYNSKYSGNYLQDQYKSNDAGVLKFTRKNSQNLSENKEPEAKVLQL